MARYLYGEDTYAARQTLLAELTDDCLWLDAPELQNDLIARLQNAQGGLFGSPTIIVRDPSRLNAAPREALAEQYPALPNTVVFWDRGKPDKRSVWWRAVKKDASEFTFPSPAELKQEVVARANDQQSSITTGAAALLIERLGQDRWHLFSELDRLCLVTDDITEAVIEQEIVSRTPAEIFSTLDALVNGRAVAAVKAVTQLIEEGASEFYILSMLAYQYRVVLLVASGLTEGKDERGIVAATRLHPFVVGKTLPVAERLSVTQAAAALTRIAATEYAIKRGTVEARTGLLMLLSHLARS